MCHAFVEEIVCVCVSLSLLMSKNLKLKKVNKSFVPEPISYLSGFIMYILRILVVYFWTWICNSTIVNIVFSFINISTQHTHMNEVGET